VSCSSLHILEHPGQQLLVPMSTVQHHLFSGVRVAWPARRLTVTNTINRKMMLV
jgi:hypothetical protein